MDGNRRLALGVVCLLGVAVAAVPADAQQDGGLPQEGALAAPALPALPAQVVDPPSEPVVPPSDDYSLLFEDDFTGTDLNLDHWYYRTGTRLGGHNLPENMSVADSNGTSALHIDYDYEDVTGDGEEDYTGGGVISRHNFGYGYYETRAKLYGGTEGFHQSFWSMGTTNQDDLTSGKDSLFEQLLEIDGFEADSGTADKASTNVHWYLPDPERTSAGGIQQTHNTTEWFVAGYEWLPGKVRFYLNGSLIRTVLIDDRYASQKVWLTGLPTPDWGEPTAPPLLDASMKVDYFRYYARKNHGNVISNPSFEYNADVRDHQHPVKWVESGDSSASLVDSADASSGAYSLRHFSNTSYQVTTTGRLELIPNSTYRLTARAKSSGGQTDASMNVTDHGGPQRSTTISPASSWTEITIDNIIVSSNRISVDFRSDGSAGQWIQIDDVVLEDITAWPSREPQELVLDNGEPGYTEVGTWSDSSLRGFNNSSTRFSTTSLGPSARWQPDIPATGFYDVSIHKIVYPTSDPNTKIDIVHADGNDTEFVDYTAGESSWVHLGRYRFLSGTQGYVENSLNTSGTHARADAVKFTPVAFTDDFESSEATDWVTTGGSWSIVPDTTSAWQQAASTEEAYGYTGDPRWDDYTFSAQVKPTSSGGYVGAVARFQDANNYYHCRLNRAANSLQLLKKEAGSWMMLASTSFIANINTWYGLKVQLVGDSLNCRIDGGPQVTALDSSFRTGHVGIRTFHGSMRIDDVEVWMAPESDVIL